MHSWLIWVLVFWTSKVHSQGFNSFGSASGQSIPIGLITDDTTDSIRRTFEHAISVVNTELAIPLSGATEQVAYGNSLQAFGQLCRLMQNGVGAVFGPSAKQTATHLLSACDAKDVPFIYPHLSWNSQTDGFNLHPHPQDIAHVLYNITNEFGWTRFVFCYESAEYLSILDHMMALYGNDGPVIKVVRYDLNLSGNYKPVLRRIRKSDHNCLVIVGSTQGVAELLRQAQQVGIMNEGYMYLVGNLDLHTFQLEEYKYSEANITGIRLFDPDKKEVRELLAALQSEEDEIEPFIYGTSPITLAMALTYDAVRVVAETTNRLRYQPQQLNCSERHDNVQPDGSTFKNYMRSLDILEKTITGRIYFEANIRKGYVFDVVELQHSGLVTIGTWQEGKKFEFNRPPQIENLNENFEEEDDSLRKEHFKILISIPNKPYASLVSSVAPLHGNNQYEGYSVDLIKAIAENLHFNYTLYNGGKLYGSFNKTTNESTGMLKEIVDGNADLVLTDLTITSERQQAVDFSLPFMNLGIAILYKKPQKAAPELFAFMDPFSRDVWMYLGVAYLGVSLCLFLLGRLSPAEWDNPYPCIDEPEELENQFTINNSLWFSTGALLQQGSEIAPKAISTRTIAATWWFFTLIMVSSYTANLAAFLTYENPTSVINNVQDLAANKENIQYGAQREGATRNFFSTSEENIYVEMNNYMKSHPDLLPETSLKGVQMVENRSNYAFLMESTTIEYNTVRSCNLLKIGEPLDEKGYGIAMPKNWPHRNKFNKVLLELQEKGDLARLKRKWWNEIDAKVCVAKKSALDDVQLGLDSLLGIFFVLVVGSIFSFVVSIIYWLYFVFKKAKFYQVPYLDALYEEFKMTIRFSQNERALKSAQSVYSRSRNSSQSIESLKTDSEENTPEND